MELGTAIKFKKLCRHNDITLRHKVNKIIPRGWKLLANYSVKIIEASESPHPTKQGKAWSEYGSSDHERL